MSKSNIALAIIAGAVICGIVAIVLKTQAALDDEEENEESDEIGYGTPRFEKIARQFSDKIASELKTAEDKIKSAMKGSPNLLHGESGIYL